MSAETFFQRFYQTAQSARAELDRLDAALGDGDHGTTLLRGMTSAMAAGASKQAKAFMRASGGASGTLFGLVLHEIECHLNDGADLGTGLGRALARICDLGEVKPGDKSMVDALAPAVAVLQRGGTPDEAATAAAQGRDATRPLHARRGRAQYVEGGGAGHLDPGAVSLTMMLADLAQESTP